MVFHRLCDRPPGGALNLSGELGFWLAWITRGTIWKEVHLNEYHLMMENKRDVFLLNPVLKIFILVRFCKDWWDWCCKLFWGVFESLISSAISRYTMNTDIFLAWKPDAKIIPTFSGWLHLVSHCISLIDSSRSYHVALYWKKTMTSALTPRSWFRYWIACIADL